MSRRLEQINKNLQHEVSKIIPELAQPEWGIVTVSDVIVSPDLRTARVWILGSEKAVEALNQIRTEIHDQLKPRLRMKYVPTITFIVDKGETARLEELLENIDES